MVWYEIAGLVLAAIGVLIGIVALFIRTSTKKSKQVQKVSGRNNTVVQAGRDIINLSSKGDDND